ncbi:MAG: outer membrane protein assembly factor [Paucimonas sp.]|nr:outer membrane protein assembly factor [Paucimonas sp.]
MPIFLRKFLLFFLALCCVPAAFGQVNYRVEVEAPSPLKKLLSDHLDLFRYRDRKDLDAEQFDFMVASAPEQVSRLAATEGYFSTATEVAVSRAAGSTTVRLNVKPGPRTTVATVNVQITGAVRERSPEQAARLLRRWRLQEGEPFRQEDWADAKQNALQRLQSIRYPAARLTDSEARILADAYRADLSASYDSGPLFRLGELAISGTNRYPDQIIRNVNPLRPGEEYSAERLLEFQRQILRTPYFSNAAIDIDRNPSTAEHAPVKVQVTEFPYQRIRAGAGYTTDTGARLDGRYSHHNLFGKAWVLDAQTRLEQRRQLGSLELAMPPAPDGYVKSVHGSAERTTLEGIDLRSRRLGVRRALSTDRRDTAYFIEYYNDSLRQLSGAALPPDVFVQPGTHQALVAGVEKTRRQVDSLVFPRDGRVVSIQASAAVKGLGSDQTFVRAYARGREYLPIGRRDVAIIRAELGAVLTKGGGTSSVPASLLFRAGGTESVRGYPFQGIGNEVNSVIYPTRFVATGGIEYQHWLTREWGGAVFYDIGTAADRWSGKDFFHAVGAGVRWRSPVGVVQADLAYGFQGSKIRPHLSLGVAF